MTSLEHLLREIIAAEGPISVERYMALCLQHPEHGYYTSRDPIGRAGDFITAPEIDQMFGELIGLWAAQVWLDLGAPHAFRLVELGPGRGTLMADALRAARIVPGFLDAAWVDLIETSERLKCDQSKALLGATRHLAWYERIEDVPSGPAVIIANEFFDALPVRHYARSPAGWHERQVGIDGDDKLVFGMASEPIDLPATSGRPGDLIEIGHVAFQTMRQLATRLVQEGGALLVCDYGHRETQIGTTLQAVRGHAYADVLQDPGEADLTAHVDFAGLARTAEAAGAATYGPLPQGTFLERLGIRERASALKQRATPAQAAALDTALDRFTSASSSMATLFKAFAVTPPNAPAPPAFSKAGSPGLGGQPT